MREYKRHAVGRHVGILADVRRTAQGDVGLDFFHAGQFEIADERGVFVVRAAQEFAGNAVVADFHQRFAAGARTARMSSTENSSGTSIMSSNTRSPFLTLVE
jgi:hypothetical protein